jgi:hypothetical protein
MSELMDEILKRKALARRKQEALSFTEKITILEKMRERDRVFAANPLRADYRQPAAILTMVASGNPEAKVERRGVLKPRVYDQSPNRPRTLQSSATVFEKEQRQSEESRSDLQGLDAPPSVPREVK